MEHQNFAITDWLPTSAKEMKAHGWEQADVILFTGDAYIDHPSFGAAVIGRVLQAQGLKVAIVPQPNWRDDLRDFKKLGQPRLFFGVTSGSMDSMVNHYTANKRLRSDDAYTPGGLAGQRPDYAVTVYSNILKELYPDVPIILGGIEASLRRFTHYDYWSDQLKPSILKESKADLLVVGMGEKTICDIAQSFETDNISSLHEISGLAYLTNRNDFQSKENDVILHSHQQCLEDKKKYAENFLHVERESNKYFPSRIVQYTGDEVLVVNPPNGPTDEAAIDAIFDLPYTRLPHPRYHNKPAIPAYEMIKFSVNIHRGCFGGCSFCTISAHQGKFIVSRSEKSVLNEIGKISLIPDFKGILSDLGGPSANMYQMKGIDLSICKTCARNSCIYPQICKNLDASHDKLLSLYHTVRELPQIRKVFIGSGIRYDIFLKAPQLKGNKEYPKELIRHHVSGRLKVAPEHTCDKVLQIMRKPSFDVYQQFHKMFREINQTSGLNQQIVPYFISSHPGCKREDMEQLSEMIRELNLKPEQVQDFTPTPMTLSTVMYYTGYDPYKKEAVYIPKGNDREKQKQYFFWYKPENKPLFQRNSNSTNVNTQKKSRRKFR